MNLSYTQTC